VNNVNFTNTRVDIARVTNAYNTVVLNRSTTVNNIVYANRNVNGGVTVVSRDTFVNARPVARNVVSVPARELAAAPVAHTVAFEPVRSSVLGAGRPVANRPPAVVTSRPVVALRTPAPMPRSFDQRQALAGGHLNQQSSSLVRQEAPGKPVPAAPVTRQPQAEDGFRSFGQPSGGTNQTKTPPRVWEAQGTPEPESTQAQSENRSVQPAQQWSHPLAKPVAPVQQGNGQQQKEEEQKFSAWHQGRSATAPAHTQQNSHPPAQSRESAPKKGR
jgi:hypothetical protein